MRRLALIAATTATAAYIVPAAAEPQSVTQDALRQLASGKTVHLESPYGTLPVTFKEDGSLSAKASGALAIYLGSTSDRGRWAVQGERICQKFFKWFHGETHCMRIKQDGRKITWRRDDGLSGTATIAANDTPPPERPVGLGVRPSETAKVQAMAEPVVPATVPPTVRAATHEPVRAQVERGVSSTLPAPQQAPAAAQAPAIQTPVAAGAASHPPKSADPLPALASSPVEARRTAAVASWRELRTGNDDRDPHETQPKAMPRPVLASLHGMPTGLLSRPVQRPSVEATEPPAAASIVAPPPGISLRDVVEEVLDQRTSHLWCEAGLNDDDLTGRTRPFLFDVIPGQIAEIPSKANSGCLMPTAVLTDIARLSFAR